METTGELVKNDLTTQADSQTKTRAHGLGNAHISLQVSPEVEELARE